MSRRVSLLLLVPVIVVSIAAKVVPVTTTLPKPPAPLPPVAMVNGEPIDGREFQMIADGYIKTSRESMKQAKLNFGQQEIRNVEMNVLGGLISDRLWIQEARRVGMAVPDSAVDGRLRRDPFFLTAGKFDESKFAQFKSAANSNYKAVFRRTHDIMIVDKLRAMLEKKYTPDDKALYAEFLKQNQTHRMRTLWVRPEASLLDPDAPHADVEAYYHAHEADYEIKDRVNCRFAVYDVGTAKDTSWEQSRAQAESLLVKLRRGARLDSTTAPGARIGETGLFERGRLVPGFRHTVALTDTLLSMNIGDVYEKVCMNAQGYGVLVVSGRKSRELRPLKDNWTPVYRATVAELKARQDDKDARGVYAHFPDRYRTRKINMRALYFDPRTHRPAGAPTRDVLERLYHMHEAAFAVVDTPGGVPHLRPFAEAESTVIKMYPEWMSDSLVDHAATDAYAQALAGRDVFSTPPRDAVLRDFPNLTATFDDTLLSPTLIDLAIALPAGSVRQVNSAVRGRLVYKVASVDTAFVPPFEEIQRRIQMDVMDARKADKDVLARRYYETHKQDFLSDTLYAIRYALVRRKSPKELGLDLNSARAYYTRHRDKYSTPERVHLQVIVFNPKAQATAEERRQREAHMDSVLALARAGDRDTFNTLARKFSEEPTSARSGGDVGTLTHETLRDTMLSREAFALKTGQVSHLIRSARGNYIFRAVEHNPKQVTAFEDIQNQVFEEMTNEVGDSVAQRIANLAMRSSKTLEELDHQAQEWHGRGLSATTPFALRDPVPNLGDCPEMKKELRGMRPGQIGKKAEKGPNSYMMWMLDRIDPPVVESFDKAHDRVILAMDKDSMTVRAKERLDSLLVRLKTSDNLGDAGYDLGNLRDTGPFARGGFIPGLGSAALVDTFLNRAKPGDISGPIAMPAAQGGGWIVCQYLGPDRPDDSAYEKGKKAIQDRLVDDKERDLLNEIKARAKVTILRPELRKAWNPVAANAGQRN